MRGWILPRPISSGEMQMLPVENLPSSFKDLSRLNPRTKTGAIVTRRRDCSPHSGLARGESNLSTIPFVKARHLWQNILMKRSDSQSNVRTILKPITVSHRFTGPDKQTQ